MGDLHSISSCNILYKTMSKALANRLKQILPKVVCENQSVFIPRQLITNNVIIGYEIFHYMRKKRVNVDGVATLNIDIAKAYDRVECR